MKCKHDIDTNYYCMACDKEKARLNSGLNDLLDCPFCGAPAELRLGELKRTLEEAIVSEKNARCSTPKCPARFIVCSVSEWNIRAT